MVFARAKNVVDGFFPNISEYPAQLAKVDETLPEYITGLYLTVGSVSTWVFLFGLLLSVGEFGFSEFILEFTFPGEIPIVGGTVALPVLMLTGAISFPLVSAAIMPLASTRQNLMDDFWWGVFGGALVLIFGAVQEAFPLSDVGAAAIIGSGAVFLFAWVLHYTVGGAKRFGSRVR